MPPPLPTLGAPPAPAVLFETVLVEVRLTRPAWAQMPPPPVLPMLLLTVLPLSRTLKLAQMPPPLPVAVLLPTVATRRVTLPRGALLPSTRVLVSVTIPLE